MVCCVFLIYLRINFELLSFDTWTLRNDVELVHEIEAELGKQLEEVDYKEKEVLSDFTKVCKAKRVATMKIMDDRFEEKVRERRKQKLKTPAEEGFLKKKDRKRKGQKPAKTSDNL
ncbi:hypothetical protein SLA2020_436450 [Shorea laevis]